MTRDQKLPRRAWFSGSNYLVQRSPIVRVTQDGRSGETKLVRACIPAGPATYPAGGLWRMRIYT